MAEEAIGKILLPYLLEVGSIITIITNIRRLRVGGDIG